MILIRFIAANMPSWLLFGMNLDVTNLIFLDIVITKETLFTKIMSSDRVMFMYLSWISDGIHTHVTIDSRNDLLVVFTFSDPRFGTNMTSAAIMSFLVTENSGSWFPLTIIR